MSKKEVNIVTIDIAPEIKGLITPRDLISASGTFLFEIETSQIVGKEGYLFKVTSPKYCLEVGFYKREVGFYKNKPVYNQLFYIARNEQKLEEVIFGPFHVLAAGNIWGCAMWEPTQLSFLFLDEFAKNEIDESFDATAEIEKRRRILKTPAINPPYSLINWARKKTIVPVTTYGSFSFYEEVVSSLQSIPDKVATIGMYNTFWDILYEGSKIVSRQPKHETDILPTIHGLLFDIAIAKNFQISREHQIAGGRLDFLISSSLKSGETANICVEFKHAHSLNLVDGLLKQLPAYMKATGIDFGVYCVLYFKGPYFSKPDEYDCGELKFFLHGQSSSAGLSNIRILVFDLSHPKPPSQL